MTRREYGPLTPPQGRNWWQKLDPFFVLVCWVVILLGVLLAIMIVVDLVQRGLS